MRFLDRVRHLNKRYTNRLLGRIARSTWGPFCIIRHTGRRSGKQYETPLIAIPTPAGYVVALTYGPGTDWYKNITAAGGCQVVVHQRETILRGVEPLTTAAGLSHFPPFERAVLRLVGVRHFALLKK